MNDDAGEIQRDFIGKYSQGHHSTSYKLIPADQLGIGFKKHIQSYPREKFPAARNLNAEQKKVRDNYQFVSERNY